MHIYFLLHVLFCPCTQKFISLTLSIVYVVYNAKSSYSLSNSAHLCFSFSCISLSQNVEGGVNEQIKLLWVCEVSIFVLLHTGHWEYVAWTGRDWEWVCGWEVWERRETWVELLSMKYFKYWMCITSLGENSCAPVLFMVTTSIV